VGDAVLTERGAGQTRASTPPAGVSHDGRASKSSTKSSRRRRKASTQTPVKGARASTDPTVSGVTTEDRKPRVVRTRAAAASSSATPRNAPDGLPSASTSRRGSALVKAPPARPPNTIVGTDHELPYRQLGGVQTRLAALIDDVTRERPSEPDHTRMQDAVGSIARQRVLLPAGHAALQLPVGAWDEIEFAILRSGLLHAHHVQTYVRDSDPPTRVATHMVQTGVSAFRARFASLFSGLFVRGHAVLPHAASALMMGDVGTTVSLALWTLLCGPMDGQPPLTDNVRAAEHFHEAISTNGGDDDQHRLQARLDLFLTLLFAQMSWAHVRVNAATFRSKRKADGGRVYVTGECAPAGEPWRFGDATRRPVKDDGDALTTVDTGEGVMALATSVNAHALWVWPSDADGPRLIAIPPFSVLLVCDSVVRAWPSRETIARVAIALAADASSHGLQLAMRDALSFLGPAPPLRTGEAKVYGIHFDHKKRHAVPGPAFPQPYAWNPRNVADEQHLFRVWQMPVALSDFQTVRQTKRMANAIEPPIDTTGDDGFEQGSGSSSESSGEWTSSSSTDTRAAGGA